MTRGKAKIKLFELIETGFVNVGEKGLIDSIYDDFENRTCKVCEYNLKDERCIANGSMVEFLDIETYNDFSCNKFKAK